MNRVIRKIKGITEILENSKKDVDSIPTKSRYRSQDERNKLVEELTKKYGRKPTTDEIMQERIAMTGKTLSEEEKHLIKVLKNIQRNIDNYPDDKEINKSVLEDISNAPKGEMPKYKIIVNSNGDIIVNIGNGSTFKLDDNYANYIYQSGALEQEKEMVTIFKNETDKLFERYEKFFGDGKKDFHYMNEVEKEEYTLVSEEILRALKNLKIHRHGKNTKIDISAKENGYIATREDKKAEIQLSEKVKHIIHRIQNDMTNDTILENINRRHFKECEQFETISDMDKSYLLYCELRDLGIKIESNKKGKLKFSFLFGDEIDITGDRLESLITYTNLPYTKKMIQHYEERYKDEYNPGSFYRYTISTAVEDLGYKMKEKELEKVKTNLKIADKKLRKLENTKFKSQPKIRRDNLNYVANGVTLSESKKHIKDIDRYLEGNRRREKLRRKSQREDKIIDWIIESLMIEDEQSKVKYILKVQEQRRKEDVANFIRDNKRWMKQKENHEDLVSADITASMIERAKRELKKKNAKMIGIDLEEER